MKYYYEWYDEQARQDVKEILTKEQAADKLSRFYKQESIPEILETPCTYRTMFGAIIVEQEGDNR